MGATTYEWILDHEGSKWPYEVPCWVFTHRELQVVPDAAITFTQGDVAPVHAEMSSAAGDRNIWVVGGGDLAGQFADARLAGRGDRLDRACNPRRGRTASSSPGRATPGGAGPKR